MDETTCRGCGAPIARGRAWCPPQVRPCLADYRASADYRRETLHRDGYACARCHLWNRVVLANVRTGRLRLLFALVQLFGPAHRRAVKGGWRKRVVDVDHIHPIGGRKGTHDAWNMQVLCFRHHARKTVRDVAGMRGQRPPLDRTVAAKWAVLVLLVAVVGFQLLTPDLRSAVAVNPANGAALVAAEAAQPSVWVPLAVLAALVAVAGLLRRLQRRVVTELAESVATETGASASMRRAVTVRRYGKVPGHFLPRPVDVIIRYPHTFRDDDPGKVDAIESRVRTRLGWTSCAVTLTPSKKRLRLRFPDPFLTAPPTASTLLGVPSHDMFDPLSVGIDETGADVTVGLVERNILVGGEPGGGKSNVLSLLIAGAAMDRNVEIWLLDGKAVEFPVWESCATRIVKGATKESFDAARELLRDLQAIVDMRFDLMAAEATEDSIKRKVEHADGMGIIVLAIDELATYTTGWLKKDLDDFVALLRDIVSRGRACGVICILATQRPSADVVPTSIRDLVGYRWALRCTTPSSSDMVLGAGKAAEGFTASRISPDARGVGLLLAEGGVPRKVRAHLVDNADLVTLARQARRLRGVTWQPGVPVETSVD